MRTASFNAQGICNSCGYVKGTRKTTNCGWCEESVKETFCDVCGRRDSWGCGHSSEQRRAARRHKTTKAHQNQTCDCFTDERDHNETLPGSDASEDISYKFD